MAQSDKTYSAQIINQALKEIRSGLVRAEMIAILLRLAGVSGAALLLFGMLESLFWLPGLWRLALIVSLIAVFVAIAGRGIWNAWKKYGRLSSVARRCDLVAPGLRNGLESALEFLQCTFQSGTLYSNELVSAALESTASAVKEPTSRRMILEGLKALQADRTRRRRLTVIVIGTLCLAFGLYDPMMMRQVLQNWSDPMGLIQKERDFRLFVRPGNVTLMRGDSLCVRVAGSMRRPEPVRFESWQTGQVSRSLTMQYWRDQYEYRLDLGTVENDLSYVVSQWNAVSDTFKVKVISNPFVTDLRLRYEYPQYSALSPWETTRDRSISALRGTRVILYGKASNPLNHAKLRFESGEMRNLALSGEREFVDTLNLVADTRYSFRLDDRWGLINRDTLSYPIIVVPDELPRVMLIYPESDYTLGEEMIQPLMYEAADDFGVSRVILSFRKEKAGGRLESEQSLLLPSGSLGDDHILEQYNWDLSALRLLPGESIIYRLTVLDNDRVSGPKAASTAENRLRFPSMQEIFKQSEKQQEQIASRLQNLGQEGQKTLEQVKKMQEALERGKEMDWQEKQRLGQALERQKQITEQVGKLAGQMKESIERLQRAESSSPELLEKLSRVQKLMEEISTDEIKELLSKINSSLEQIDRKSLNEQMNKLEYSQEKLLDKLDKTISVLEKVKLEQQMDFLVNRTRELAEAARMLADSADENSSAKQAQIEQADSAKADSRPGDSRQESPVDSISPSGEGESMTGERQPSENGERGESLLEMELAGKEPGEANEQMREMTAEVFERMESAANNLDKAGEKELADSLKKESNSPDRDFFKNAFSEIGRDMSGSRPDKAVGRQREVGDRMENVHRKMKSYSLELKKKWREQVSEAMLRAFDNLDFLSRRQEELSEAVRVETDINHPDVLKLAALQQEISEGLNKVMSGIVAAARDNFFISIRLLDILDAAVARSEGTVDKLSADQRNQEEVFLSSSGALAAINAGMLSLIEDRDNMMQSGSGVGMDQMLKKLEQLSRHQEDLNRKARQQSSNGQGEGPGLPSPRAAAGGIQEMLRQMAAEQKAIQEQLARMAEQAGQSSETGRLKDALEGMNKEAHDLVQEMLQKGVRPETLERQQRLLDRMLSAQRAMKKNESGDNERKSETARSYNAVTPAALPKDILDPALKKGEIESLFEKWSGTYPESYNILIRKYFERLNVEKDKEQKQ